MTRQSSQNRPQVILFNAVSLDGRTTGFEVDLGLFYGIAQGFGEDATLAGCDTLLAATPADAGDSAADSATAKDGPLLVAVDSRGRLTNWSYWTAQPMWTRWISLGSERTPKAHLDRLERAGVRALRFGDDRVDIATALDTLAKEYDIGRLRVESGGHLNGALLAAGLADELHLLVHPVLAGGTQGPRFDEGLPAQLFNLEFAGSELQEGGNVLLSYRTR